MLPPERNKRKVMPFLIGFVGIINKICGRLIVCVNHLVQHFVLFIGTEDVLFSPPSDLIRLFPQMFVSSGAGSDPCAPIQTIETLQNCFI